MAAHEALPKADHPLFLRTMLLMPWEHSVRSTGLSLRVSQVLEVLGPVAKPEALASAAGAVIASGIDAARKHRLDGVLLNVRELVYGILLGPLPELQRTLGVTDRRVAHDRVETAVRCFLGSAWEANLRVLVPWWLNAIGEERAEPAVNRLVTRISRSPRKGEAAVHLYLLLGLLDWAIKHPRHAHADDLLHLGVDGKTGPVRKTAAELATAMKRTDVLEKLARLDPDRAVRKRAEKLLLDLKVNELF